jgi:Flp pilus assembly protein TadD
LEPENADAHDRLGRALVALKRWEEAVEPLREAIRLEPENADAHDRLGRALVNLERREEAVAPLREAIRLEPGNADAHYALGSTLVVLKRWEEAVVPFREVIRLKPEDADAHYHLGGTLVALERWEEAVASLREAIRLEPGNADTHYLLGATLVELQRREEAVAPLREAIRLEPGNADTHYLLGVILVVLKRWEEAVVPHREAIRIDLICQILVAFASATGIGTAATKQSWIYTGSCSAISLLAAILSIIVSSRNKGVNGANLIETFNKLSVATHEAALIESEMEILLPEIKNRQVSNRLQQLLKRANEIARDLNVTLQEVPSFHRRYRRFETVITKDSKGLSTSLGPKKDDVVSDGIYLRHAGFSFGQGIGRQSGSESTTEATGSGSGNRSV